ncbi:MAG: hypothetical protein Q3971_02270 [Moraxella sp.]|nr:hypothetical protein [Moraxella sp.]
MNAISRLPPHGVAMMSSRLHRACHLCGEPNAGRLFDPIGAGLLCDVCEQSIKPLPAMSVDGIPLLVAHFYDVPFNHIMTAYKDHENLSAFMVLCHLLSTLPKPKGLMAHRAVIMPTPTTSKRLIKRGFNPVLTLAKHLSYLWQIPIWQGMSRHDNATHQRGLDKSARLSNVKDDFYLTDELSAHQVVLFDDVITTGATLTAMADVIRTHYPKVRPIGVGVLHGKADLHLPIFGK